MKFVPNLSYSNNLVKIRVVLGVFRHGEKQKINRRVTLRNICCLMLSHFVVEKVSKYLNLVIKQWLHVFGETEASGFTTMSESLGSLYEN